MILGIGLPPHPFLFFNDAVGAKSDFLRIDLKSKGPASSSSWVKSTDKLIKIQNAINCILKETFT